MRVSRHRRSQAALGLVFVVVEHLRPAGELSSFLVFYTLVLACACEGLRPEMHCHQVSDLCCLPFVVSLASRRLADSTCRVTDAHERALGLVFVLAEHLWPAGISYDLILHFCWNFIHIINA